MQPRRGTRPRWGFLTVLAIAAIAAVGVVTLVSVGAPREREAPRHYPSADPELRTLLVAPAGTETLSGSEGSLVASLVGGVIPAQPVVATVVSDTNCAPDADGVSHCYNQLRMPDATVLEVQHHHRMADTPCLAPGEQVLVSSA